MNHAFRHSLASKISGELDWCMATPLRLAYDPAKARSNLRKHGISFTEAETVFLDPLAITVPNEAHSDEETVRSRSVTPTARESLL